MIDHGAHRSRTFYGALPDSESDVTIEFAEATEDLEVDPLPEREDAFDLTPDEAAAPMEFPPAAPPFVRMRGKNEPTTVRPHRIDRRSTSPRDRRDASLDSMKRKRQAGPALIQPDHDESERLPLMQPVAAWIRSPESGSLAVSGAFHLILLVCLSLIILSNLDDNDAISMVLTEDDGLPMELEEVMDLSLEQDGGSETTSPLLQQVPTDSVTELLMSDLSSTLPSVEGSGEGTGAGEGEAFMFKMPTGGRAVTKGSFTAWTVPKDPEPEKDYKIVILIRLPKNVRSYRVADLSGQVRGTDGYFLQIPFDVERPDHTLAEKRTDRLMPVRRTDRLRVRDNQVQIVVNVDGAASLIRDTIEVRSKLLKEEQKLEIVF